MDPREYCPACYMHLGTSLTSCACGWKMFDPMPRQDLELPPPVGFVPRAKHDRLIAEKDAELAAARDKALEDAARMVDCACECREAVLTANTRVERWTACGRDPCGALDAAAIRALIDKPGE